jgi:hypothetical protein
MDEHHLFSIMVLAAAFVAIIVILHLEPKDKEP